MKSFIPEFIQGKCLLVGIAVTLLNVAHAQIETVSQQELVIHLQQALQMAKDNYPSIKAKQAGMRGSSFALKEAKTEYIPELITQNQALYGTANGVRGAFFPSEGTAIPISGGINPGQDWTATFGSFTTIMLDWKFFNFGRVRANVDVARAEQKSATADLDNEIFQQQIKVTDAYLLFLIYNKLVSVQENNLKRADVFRTATTASVRSGLKPGIDTSFANAEYAKAELLLLEAKKNKRQQRIRLAELIGNSNESIEPDTMRFYTIVPLNENVNESLLKNNPLLKLYESNILTAKARTTAINRSYLPSIGIMAAGWARGSGIDNQANADGTLRYDQSLGAGIQFKAYNYMVNLHFKWNISSYPKVHYQTQEQKFKAQESQYLYDEQALKLKRSLENADMQYELSFQQSKKAPVQLSYSRTAYNQAQGRYNSGLATLIELSQNLFIVNRAEVDISIATNNVWRALLMKAAATGDLSVFTNQAFK
jgi:outer membrane protein TolC